MRYPFLLIATMLFISSCCGNRKVDCAINMGPTIQLSGYSPADLDTVIVKKYQPGTNLTILVDSIMRSYPDSTIARNMTFGGSNDYVVEIPATDQTVTLTNAILRTYVCGECRTLFDSDPGVRGQEVESMEINGVRTENTVYELVKP